MEDLLLLAVFSYPGALADLVYTTFAEGREFYKDPSSAGRVARDFFFSSIIALPCMHLTIPGAPGAHTLTNWMDLLQKSELFWRYMLITCIGAVLVGFAYLGLAYLGLLIRNKQPWRKSYFKSPHGDIWSDIVENPQEVDLVHSAIVVRNAEDKILCCGLPYVIPRDIKKDPALGLMWCDQVRAELDKQTNHEESMIRNDVVVYYDMQTGNRIEIRDAWELYEKLRQQGVTSSEDSAENSASSEGSA